MSASTPPTEADSAAVQLVRKPQRWDQPLDPSISDADVRFLLNLEPFNDLDPKVFPKATPLEGIIRNDTRLLRLEAGQIAVRQGDFGQSAYLVLDGKLTAKSDGLETSEDLKRKASTSPGESRFSLIDFFGLRPRHRFAESRKPEEVLSKQTTTRETQETEATRHAVQGFDPHFRDGVATLDKGEIFGEVAALYRIAQPATIVAAEPTTLLEIRWQGLRILKRDNGLRDKLESHYRLHWMLEHLASVPMFRFVPEPVMKSILHSVSIRNHGTNEWNNEYRKTKKLPIAEQLAHEPLVCTEGNIPTDLIVVRNGFGRLTRQHGASEQTLAYLGKGHIFGIQEIAEQIYGDEIHRPVTYQTSLRAVGFLDTLQIPIEVFIEKIFPHIRRSELPIDQTIVTRIQKNDRRGGRNSAEVRGRSSHQDQSTPVAQNLQSTPMLEFIVEHRFNNGRDAMVIDLHRCTRCDACVEACAAIHDGNPRFLRNGPRHDRFQFPHACMHCDDPVCLVGCPTAAIFRDATNGMVAINEATCIGCGVCANACPYENIVMVAIQDPKGRPYRDEDRGAAISKATKCDGCVDLQGGPACVAACGHDALVRLDLTSSAPLNEWLEKRGIG